MSAFFLGLDLGQSQDFSALAALQCVQAPAVPPAPDTPPGPTPLRPRSSGRRFACPHLQRWPLGTPYPQIVEDVRALLSRPPLAGCILGIDATGVGRAVADLFRRGRLNATLRPVVITGGHQVTKGDDGYLHVPKKDLVSVVQVLLQSRRLQVAQALPHAQTLASELLAFRVKVTTSSTEVFEAWRERDHDDLVLAIAIAAWLGERGTPGRPAAGGERDGAVLQWRPPEVTRRVIQDWRPR